MLIIPQSFLETQSIKTTVFMTHHLPPPIINVAPLIDAIERRIKSERINVNFYSIMGDEPECIKSKSKIADAKIILLRVQGYLPF